MTQCILAARERPLPHQQPSPPSLLRHLANRSLRLRFSVPHADRTSARMYPAFGNAMQVGQPYLLPLAARRSPRSALVREDRRTRFSHHQLCMAISKEHDGVLALKLWRSFLHMPPCVRWLPGTRWMPGRSARQDGE